MVTKLEDMSRDELIEVIRTLQVTIDDYQSITEGKSPSQLKEWLDQQYSLIHVIKNSVQRIDKAVADSPSK